MPQPPTPSATLRLYPSKWSGPVLLVCRKCEKKLKKSGTPLKIRKSLKYLAREDRGSHPVQVISIGCMDLCPKGGVTICPPRQLSQAHPGLVIVRTQQELATLYNQCQPASPGL